MATRGKRFSINHDDDYFRGLSHHINEKWHKLV